MRSGVVRQLDYPHSSIKLLVRSEVEYYTRLHSCKKEPETVAWIENEFAPGDVFYDVGANVGAYSLVAAKHFEGKVKVVAFEPGFANYAALCFNIFLNECGTIITPVAIALSDRNGMEKFNYQSIDPGEALHALGDAIDQSGMQFEPKFQHGILSMTLSHFADTFDLPAPRHLKIDVDGTEMSVLRGAQKLLDEGTVRTILIEAGSTSVETEITQYLGNLGYSIIARHARGTTDTTNLIFRHPSSR